MPNQDKPRLMIANVFYAPHSYGGATVVAENMAKLLARDHGWKVLIVSTFYDSTITPYTLKRYAIDGVDVIAVCVPFPVLSFESSYANPDFDAVFNQILTSFAPDVAHIHCVQQMGASFFSQLSDARIPFAVTIHDCWWICERQFMISSTGSYCHQEKVDMDICRHCVADVERSVRRRQRLDSLLALADCYLFPSDYFRQLGITNGLPAEKCQTNKNGIVKPSPNFYKQHIKNKDLRLRFGFAGGPGPNKGAMQILGALRSLERTDYELVIVDAAQNAGHSWRHYLDWTVPGKLTFHPAYSSETMDEFFSKIDVLLFPSQWKESFGLTVREALARNIWVIATNAGGVAEDCVDSVNSTLIPMTHDHRPLLNAIEAVLQKPDMAKFVNPRRTEILDTESQASELSDILQGLRHMGK